MSVTPLASPLGNDHEPDRDDRNDRNDRDERVRLFYSRKTQDILHKYGPGPRVHYHVGMFADGQHPPTTVPQQTLKQRLVGAQEAIVDHAARSWGAYEKPPRRLLDIGCGLGGAALYWAQAHGSRVTGLTIAAEHVPIVGLLARRAGVGRQVTPVLRDVHDLDEHRRYDAAYALESSGYTERARLFEVVARALVPGGWFGIQEHFVRNPEWLGFVDGYYRTRLGTLEEYLTAASAAGFELVRDEDVTDAVTEFWMQSMAWNTAELDQLEGGGASAAWTRERLRDSTVAHGKLFRLWRDHALETRLLLFRLGAGR
ncbi:SAM-dependent methyltransferase [Streptomyces sp. NPDC012888]|uniref:SAM-dependent methyltransferase n=1 Tax=Streptomyces sp. NPDC012888 TaxID=3364855 RepID=UPI00369EE1D7